MIAKRFWFRRRKYGGWGVSPKTWQGWLYLVMVFLPFIVFQSLPYWSTQTRLFVTIGWLVFLFIDIFPVMVTVNRDERESIVEARSERNAAWFMVMVLVIGIVYETISSALQNTLDVNLFLIIALFGGAIVKTLSNIYFDKQGI